MAASKVTSIRGMGDVLPVGQSQFIYQSANWTWVRSRFVEWVELHGYRYIETPVVEELELFKRTSGETSDVVGKEMYLVRRSSLDTSDGASDLCLRPEGSAGVCRAVAEHGLSRNQSNLKFYYVAPMFRSERPQRGRYRQHTQLGAEIFKEPGAAADVEIIALLYGFYRGIGLDHLTVHLNSVGDSQCRPIYRDALIAFLEPFRGQMSEDSERRLYVNPMRCLDSKDPKDIELFRGAPQITDFLNQECADHFAEVKLGLTKLGIPFELDPRLVRGLDYYTKTAFEVKCNTLDGAIKTIGGGGRYDGLVAQIGGPSTPGVGFGSGIERVLLALESQKAPIPAPPNPAVLVAYLDDGVKYDAFALAEELRRAGVFTEFVYEAKNVKKQFKAAADFNVRYVVLVGGDEWARGEVRIKNFATGEQQDVPRTEAVAGILRRLQEG